MPPILLLPMSVIFPRVMAQPHKCGLDMIFG